MTILITGANGNVSSALLHSLGTKPGLKLRALVRDATKAPQAPGLEIAVGDLEHPAGLADAFAGVDTLWLLNSMGPQAPHASSNAVWAARQAGVRHIERLSAIGAAHDAPTRNGRLHALSDLEVRESGIPSTILRPAFFMQNLIGSVQGGTVYHALGEGRIGMIDIRDIADAAAEILTDPAPHAGRVYTLTGPQRISMGEAARTLTEVLGKPVAAQEVSAQDALAAMLGAGLPPWVAEVSAVEYGAAYARGWGDYTTPDQSAITGRPGRTFAGFARDHAAALSR